MTIIPKITNPHVWVAWTYRRIFGLVCRPSEITGKCDSALKPLSYEGERKFIKIFSGTKTVLCVAKCSTCNMLDEYARSGYISYWL